MERGKTLALTIRLSMRALRVTVSKWSDQKPPESSDSKVWALRVK